MNGKMKKMVSMLLALMILMSATSFAMAEGEKEYPEYLNVESYAPIIKDEYKGQIKLSVSMVQSTGWAEFENTWFYQYLTNVHNLELEVVSIPADAQNEQKNLLFASQEVPDMMLNWWMSTSDLMKYGVQEEMLLKQDEYINPVLTPGIYDYLYEREEYASARKAATLPDGHIYSLPYLVANDNPAAHYAMYIDGAALEKLDLQIPQTLDEFTEALYAFKEADLAGVGSENVYPFGGGIKEVGVSNTMYLLNALGYLTGNDTYGTGPAMRNGEVVIPAYDTEVYGEFIKLMNQYYNDGIINPNFITIETAEISSQLASGISLTSRVLPSTSFGGDNTGWTAASPLTSEWHPEKEATRGSLASVGNLAISADTEYPEVCMRIYDLFFNMIDGDPKMVNIGTAQEGDEFGFMQCVYTEEGGGDCKFPDLPQGVNYLYDYNLGFFPHLGASQLYDAWARHFELHGITDWKSDNWFDEISLARRDAVMPYLVDGYPYVYYLEGDALERSTDLKSVIEPYMREQVALFITGRRPLDEIDDYRKELESMGCEELLNIYKEAYAAQQ